MNRHLMNQPCFRTRLLLMVGLVLGLSVEAAAADHFVRPGATGSGNGSDWTNAYTTLPAALVRGDTYYLAGGSYGSHTFGDAGTATITLTKATDGAHGAAVGWNSAYGSGQALFSNLSFTKGNYVIDGATGGGPGQWESGLGICVQGTNHTVSFDASGIANVTFKHVEVVGGGRAAASDTDLFYLVYPYTNITISRCLLRDVSRTMILTWPASGNGFTIEYSKFARNGIAEHREAWSAGADSNVTIRNNLFEDIYGTGFIAIVNSTGDATNWNIHGNVFYHTGKFNDGMINTGVIFNRYDGAGGPINVRAVNWNIHNNAFVGIVGYTSAVATQNGVNYTVSDNIWYNNKTDAAGAQGATSADYNIFTANTRYSGSGSIDAASTSGAQDLVGSSTPFSDAQPWLTGNWAMRAALPGVALSATFNQDPLGVTRGADGVWDRGPYEFVSGVVDTTPPTVPAGLTATAASATQINLSWTASTDNIVVAGYRIFRGGTQIGTSTGTTYSSTGLSPATAYSFTVAAYDGATPANVSAQSASVSATTQANHAPVAQSQSVNLSLNTAQAITLVATDADGDALTYAIVTNPAHGTLTGSGTSRTYTPTTGYAGADSFTFTATDARSAVSNTATVTLAISATESLWGSQTGTAVTNDGTVYDLGTIFSPTVAGQVQGIRFYVASGESGAHTARLWNTAGSSLIGGPYTLTVSTPGWYVYNLATPVTVSAGVSYTVVVSTGADSTHAYALGTAVSSAGGNGAHLNYPANAGVFTTTLGTLPTQTYAGSNYLRDVLFVPGTANRAPVATAQSVSTAEDTAKAITLAATDADGDALTYSVVANPTHGTLSGSGTSRTYTPVTGYSGADSFSFKANDGTVDSNTATVSIAVTAVSGGTLSWSVSASSVADTTATCTLTVQRTASSAGAVSVAWATSASGATAVAGSDYVAASGTLSWAAGDATAKTATITLHNVAHPTTVVFPVVLSSPTGGAVLGTATTFVTLLESSLTAPPAPWTSQDIGSVQAVGSSNLVGGTFTLAGSGVDIWGGGDGFRYLAQPLTGDGQIDVRVLSQSNTSGWAKAGLMFRATMAARSPHASIFVTPTSGVAFDFRTVAASASGSIAGPRVAAPEWLRLKRVGNVFTAYASPDGVTWTLVGSQTIVMGSTISVGLAVSSHANGQLSVATFSGIQLIPTATN